MKKIRKIVCLIVASTVAVACASCTKQKDTRKSNKEVTIKWMFSGPGKQADADIVWEKYNQMLKTYDGLSNVSVDFEVIPLSDYRQKFMLKQTSGNTPDIAATYTLDYNKETRNETFLELSKLIDKYAPDIRKEIPEWVMKLTQVDSKQYAITNYQQMNSAMYGYAGNKDNMSKYLDMTACQKVLYESDILDDATMDIFEQYLQKLKDNNQLHLGIFPGSTHAMKGYETIYGPYVFRIKSDKVVVENSAELDSMKLLMKRFDTFYKKGFIREDVLSAQLSSDVGKANGYDLWLTQCMKGAEQSLSLKYGFPIAILQPEKEFHIPASASAGGTSILSSCKNPEIAMKVLGLNYTSKGKELYQTLVYGLENKHYKKITQNRIEPIGYIGGQGDSNSPYGQFKWILGNTANSFETPADFENWNDYIFNDLNKNAIKSKIAGFSFDDSQFEATVLQCNAVYGEYIDQITSGALPDCNATYDEFMKKLKIAGNDELKKEIQKQIDEFLGVNQN